MAIGERIGTMIVLEEERPAVISEPTGFVWRVEYTILLGVMALLIRACRTVPDQRHRRGLYLPPSPAGATVVGGGALLGDFLGVPAFVCVGLVAGLGEAIGELSGYAAGYGGRFIIQEKPAYARIHDWMEKRGVITMFLMSTVPNPLFDVAGLAAGAVRMSMRSFFGSVLGGKVIMHTWLAAAGGFGVGLFTKIL
ncbi:MAG: VTT domain-containing protein [Chloroflexi bacterium]|nr:MAG: VTT domain-containing protein [Chloroflexota bacterium]